MLDVQSDEVAPASSPGPAAPAVPATDPSSAGTQNTAQQQGQVVTDTRGNVIPPWRVNEMVQQASERAVAQAEARFAQERQQLLQSFDQRSQAQQQTIMQALQQRAAAPSRSPQEEAERQQAQHALNGLLSDHPEWGRMQQYAKAGPALAQGVIAGQQWQSAAEQRMAQLEHRLAQSHVTGEERRLEQMAASAGIRTPQDVAALNDHVAEIIARFPQAHQAFLQGDPRVLPAAFEQARQERAAYAQAGRAAFAETKTATRNLPPPLRGGGVPGSAAPAPLKFNPADPGARERAIWKQGRELLAEKFASG
jgi:hypothetical protein